MLFNEESGEYEPDYTSMIGHPLASVTVSTDKKRITFAFADGQPSRTFRVVGDCCSRSWIEHLNVLCDPVEGAIVTGVVHGGQVRSFGTGEWDDLIRVYNVSFRTNRGEIILEFRNAPNGYCGGSLVDDDDK